MEDRALIARAISGDDEAFKELVKRHFDHVLRAVRSVVNDPLDAEDITQEAFLRVYLRLSELRDPSSFRAWAMRIALNLAADLLRGREETIPLNGLDPDRLAVPSFEEDLLRDELLEEAAREMEGLSEREREALKKWLFEGKSYGELSEELGLSYDAAFKRVRRGLRKLAERLRAKLGGLAPIPWDALIKTLGGVSLKLSVKTVALGVGFLIAGGLWIWIATTDVERPGEEMGNAAAEPGVTEAASAQSERNGGDVFAAGEFGDLLDAVMEEYRGLNYEEDEADFWGMEPAIIEGDRASVGEATAEVGSEGDEADEEYMPEELMWAIERIREICAREREVDEKLRELHEENEGLIQLALSYERMGMEEEASKIWRRQIFFVKNEVEPVSDERKSLMDERFRLLEIVGKYALEGNPIAIEFLRNEHDYFYKKLLREHGLLEEEGD